MFDPHFKAAFAIEKHAPELIPQVAKACAHLGRVEANMAIEAAIADRVRSARKSPPTSSFREKLDAHNGNAEAATKISGVLATLGDDGIEKLVVQADLADRLSEWGLAPAAQAAPAARAALQPDPRMLERFLRHLAEPHIGKPMRFELVAFNGMAKPRDKSPDVKHTLTTSIRLNDGPTFGAGLPKALEWIAMLHAASVNPEAGVKWNIYYALHLIPDGADRKTAAKKGGIPLGLHIDIDHGDAGAILEAFCAETGIPLEALDIVNTGTQPNQRRQAIFLSPPIPDQLSRLKNLARKIGADENVYLTTQILRLPGAIAWPWKGGQQKEGRVPELVTWIPATARYGGPITLPPVATKPDTPRTARPEGARFENAEWTPEQHAAAHSYAQVQAAQAAELPDGYRFIPRVAMMRRLAALREVGLISDSDFDLFVEACEAETGQPDRYYKLAEQILDNPFGENGEIPDQARAEIVAGVELVIAAIRAGERNAEGIERHRMGEYLRGKNAVDWHAEIAQAEALGLGIEMDPPAAPSGGQGAPSGGSGAGEPFGAAGAPPGGQGAGSTQAEPMAGFRYASDEKPTPPPYLVKKLLLLSGVAIVGGQSGAGKTYLITDLAVSLASGQPFFGHKVREKVGVAILAAEGGGTLHSRIWMAAKYKCGGASGLPIAYLDAVPNLADQAQALQMTLRLLALDRMFREKNGVRLGAVIIDTISAACAIENENDAAAINAVMQILHSISATLACVVIPVHHHGKDASTGLRGSSAWHASADMVLSALADRSQTTGKSSGRSLCVAKNRFGEEGWSRDYMLAGETIGFDEDGEPYGDSYIVVAEEVAPERTTAKTLTRAEKLFLEVATEAIGKQGREIDPGGDGQTVKAVDLETVRVEFYARWPADGATDKQRADAKRKRFNVGRDGLQDQGRIDIREMPDRATYVWLTGVGDPKPKGFAGFAGFAPSAAWSGSDA